MSDPSESPWSNHPNAPQVPPFVYLAEKIVFAGHLTGMITYGIVVALFFQCMATLFSSANSIRRGIRWALVAHTVALFLFLMIPVGIDQYYLSIEYINNREFPGDDEHPPGPFGYDEILATAATNTVFNVMFPLNQWLADGLLLHRCYLIYSMNHRVMAFPYLMYLTSVVLGVAYIYYGSGARYFTVATINFTTSYYSICLSLNILLTLMIVIRLIMHVRNIRKVTGASDGSGGLHTVATMLIESYALYAVALLLYIIPWTADSLVLYLFSRVLGGVQVIAPYLIILRVAKRRAVTSESISGMAESIRFKSQGTTDADGSLADGDLMNSTEVTGETTGDLIAGNESAIEEVPL